MCHAEFRGYEALEDQMVEFKHFPSRQQRGWGVQAVSFLPEKSPNAP
jgi:hypothetical protein